MEEQNLLLAGQKTMPAVIYKSESHKLRQAFPVKNGDTIVQGQPVKLNPDGTISPYTGADSEVYLGIAETYSKYPCYPPTEQGVEVTVMVQGFAIVIGASADAVNAGYVTPDEVYNKYQSYVQAEPNKKTNFICLNQDSGEGTIYVLVR